jgi:hypothetical protein
MKTDENIRQLVVVAIRRHSMDLETWEGTRLWESAERERQSELSARCSLAPDELPIIYSYCDAQNWTFVTTRHIWSCNEGNVQSVAVAEVTDHSYGNFKGFAGQEMERMTVTSRDGSVRQCPFQTGKPSMGTIYAVRTLLHG